MALLIWSIGTLYAHWRARRKLPAQIPTHTPPVLQLWEGERPKVSLLVPAWNEAVMLPRFFASFQALRYPNKELILCVGGQDGSLALAQGWASEGVKVLEQRAGQGKWGAIQQMFAHATGRIIYLTDADCLLNDIGFEGIIRPLRRVVSNDIITQQEVATTGTHRPLPEQEDDPFVALQWAKLRVHRLGQVSWYTDGRLIGSNFALDAATFAQFYKQVPPTAATEDSYLGQLLHRADIPILALADCTVATEYPSRFFPYLRQQLRWSRGHRDLFATQRTTVNGLYGLHLVGTPVIAGLCGWWGVCALGLYSWSSLLAVYARQLWQIGRYHHLPLPRFPFAIIKIALADALIWGWLLLPTHRQRLK